MFAKQLPKILEGLGIKLDGDGKFQLNPLRKLEKEALGGELLKKPNDALQRLGKEIVLAAPHGIQTLGKKTIGGIDASRNGKGFAQGWNRTHGTLYNNIHKKLDEWAPDTADARKDERVGREEVAFLKNKWTRGKQSADKLYDYMKANGNTDPDPFKALNGTDEDAYKQVYKNSEFIRSRMEMDKVDAKNKILQRISEQTMRGVSVSAAIKAEENAINELAPEQQTQIMNIQTKHIVAGMSTDDINAQIVANFSAELDTTSKQLSGMEKVHESIRKQNAADAATEDALKHVKYNPVDPTMPTRTTKGSGGSNWNR